MNATVPRRVAKNTAFGIYYGVQKRVLERYGTVLPERLKRNAYVRVKASGRIAQIIDLSYGARYVIQMNPFPMGKGRHKNRRTVMREQIEPLNAMEVLAEAARG